MEATKRCPYCAEEILSAAIKCKHCASDLSANASATIAAPSGLIWNLPARLRKKLSEVLQRDEIIAIQLRGAAKEALICTDHRVLILKTGWMTGHIFGTNLFQTPYRNVTSAQVNSHLITGYFELSAGGVQDLPTSYWASGRFSPQKRDNCVSIGFRQFRAFQQAAGFIVEASAIAAHSARGIVDISSPAPLVPENRSPPAPLERLSPVRILIGILLTFLALLTYLTLRK